MNKPQNKYLILSRYLIISHTKKVIYSLNKVCLTVGLFGYRFNSATDLIV